MVRVRYRPILVFRLSLVCRKLKFSAGIQLFGMKTTSYGKPHLKNYFLGQIWDTGRFRARSRYGDTLGPDSIKFRKSFRVRNDFRKGFRNCFRNNPDSIKIGKSSRKSFRKPFRNVKSKCYLHQLLTVQYCIGFGEGFGKDFREEFWKLIESGPLPRRLYIYGNQIFGEDFRNEFRKLQ